MIKQHYIQTIGELVIPLLGFFFWKWTLHHVVLFICLDLIFSHFFSILKYRKINAFGPDRNPKNEIIKSILLNTSLVLVVLVLGNIAAILVQSNTTFSNSLHSFFFLKEFGIPQGYLLLPLLILANTQLYKLNFIKPQLFRHQTVRQLSTQSRFSLLVTISGSAIAIGIASLFPLVIPIWIWLIVFLGVKFYFDLKAKS